MKVFIFYHLWTILHVRFIDNTALAGWWGHLLDEIRSYFKLVREFSSVTFYYNSATDYGGAVYVLYDTI